MTGSELKELCDNSISILEKIWDIIEDENLQDTQIILDWLDRINEISIRN